MKINLTQVSSLEKILLNKPVPKEEFNQASVLKGEEFAYQIAYTLGDEFVVGERIWVTLSLESPLSEYIKIYDVGNIPAAYIMPTHEDYHDDDYISKEPGLFPDILNKPVNGNSIKVHNANNAIWIEFKPTGDIAPGVYPITVTFTNEEREVCQSKTFNLEIINAQLPEQKLIFTQWFHGDCIATYYKEEMFSESHWEHLENFIQTAADNGINMLLTPVFTPPLDTAVGGERPTIQLVDVFVNDGKYSFNFDKLRRWIDMCKKCGIKYFEISHLFTQWGAKFTPKVMAQADGVEKRIFGWDVEATSKAYIDFLDAFLPALIEVLNEENIADTTYFHVSDEPYEENLDSYIAAANLIKPYLKNFKIVDALSSYELYESGAVEKPIPAINHIKPFLNIDGLWTYYCCSQGKGVSNRFFAMPSYRNRVIGAQMFKFNIEGFLQWGYNFYYSQHSLFPINPYLTTDAYYAFPAGDSFSVYPGEDGKAIESLRLKVFKHALQDMSAMEYLAELTSREEVISLIDSRGEVEFDKYPKSAEYILSLREEINNRIKSSL